jgi:hypothetical protein
LDKKDIKYIIKIGALLCKNNTNKLRSCKKVEIVYTHVRNLEQTNVQGCVKVTNEKVVVI